MDLRDDSSNPENPSDVEIDPAVDPVAAEAGDVLMQMLADRVAVADVLREADKLVAGITLQTSADDLLRGLTDLTLRFIDAHLSGEDVEVEPWLVSHFYVSTWNKGFVKQRAMARADKQVPLLSSVGHLPAGVIVRCIAHGLDVARVNVDGHDNPDRRDLLTMYHHEGLDAGLYVECGSLFNRLASEYNPTLDARAIEGIKTQVYDAARVLKICDDEMLTPVANGVFDHRTNTLVDFDPSMVFTTKLRTNYRGDAGGDVTRPDAMCPGGVWSLDGWMHEVAGGDPAVVRQLRTIVQAVVRPRLKWEKAFFLYNPVGSNGKGTYLNMLRHVVGSDNVASLSVERMDAPFALADFVGKSVNLVDEVPVGKYVDQAANFKALVTQDPVTIDRKYKQSFTTTWEGVMVFCLNEMLRVKDKSPSMMRRLAFVTLPSSFTGRANHRIKHEHVVSTEVAETLLYRALHDEFQGFPDSEASRELMDTYRLDNDPFQSFMSHVVDVAAGDWDITSTSKCLMTHGVEKSSNLKDAEVFMPYAYMYEWYKGWRLRYAKGSSELSERQFTNRVNEWADEQWAKPWGQRIAVESRRQLRVGGQKTEGGLPVCGSQAWTIAGDSNWSMFQIYVDGRWMRADVGLAILTEKQGHTSSPVAFRWMARTPRQERGLLFDFTHYATNYCDPDSVDPEEAAAAQEYLQGSLTARVMVRHEHANVRVEASSGRATIIDLADVVGQVPGLTMSRERTRGEAPGTPTPTSSPVASAPVDVPPVVVDDAEPVAVPTAVPEFTEQMPVENETPRDGEQPARGESMTTDQVTSTSGPGHGNDPSDPGEGARGDRDTGPGSPTRT